MADRRINHAALDSYLSNSKYMEESPLHSANLDTFCITIRVRVQFSQIQIVFAINHILFQVYFKKYLVFENKKNNNNLR